MSWNPPLVRITHGFIKAPGVITLQSQSGYLSMYDMIKGKAKADKEVDEEEEEEDEEEEEEDEEDDEDEKDDESG